MLQYYCNIKSSVVKQTKLFDSKFDWDV